MFALDTNVISELTRRAPDDAVVKWFNGVPPESLFVPAVVVSELLAGVELLSAGEKRRLLEAFVREFIANVGLENIIDFGMAEAAHYATIVAQRQKQGRRIMIADAQVAASAAARNLPVVTRNVRDFEHCGVKLINPWEHQ